MRFAVFAVCLALPAAADTLVAKNAPIATPYPGSLVLSSVVDGADVYIDGNKVGTTPLQPLPLAAGEHTIKVTKVGFAPFIDVFTINKKKQTNLSVEPTPIAGVIKVTVNVEQAHVFVDGKFIGEAPLTAEVGVGARAIQVSKGGYKDYFQNVDAVAGQETSIEVALEELPMGLNPYKPTPPPPPKLYEKWWVWTAAAGALAVAVVVVVTPTVVLANKDPVKDFGATYNFTISAAK
jgi:PEGA domain